MTRSNFLERDEELFQDDPNYIYDFLAESITIDLFSTSSFNPLISPDDDYTIDTLFSPMISNKWGQNYPFNTHMPDLLPILPYIPQFRGHHAVGCGVLAATQIMLFNRHPSYLVHPNNSWDTYWWIGYYTNVEDFYYDTFDSTHIISQINTVSELAEVFPYIAELCNATYDLIGTYVKIYDVADALRYLDSSYYSDAVVCIANYAMSSLLKNIRLRKPIYIRGVTSSSTNDSGHAWIVDGYAKISYHGASIPLLHFDWGFLGENDGYYALGSFDLANRFFCSFRDPSTVNEDFPDFSRNILFINY